MSHSSSSCPPTLRVSTRIRQLAEASAEGGGWHRTTGSPKRNGALEEKTHLSWPPRRLDVDPAIEDNVFGIAGPKGLLQPALELFRAHVAAVLVGVGRAVRGPGLGADDSRPGLHAVGAYGCHFLGGLAE